MENRSLRQGSNAQRILIVVFLLPFFSVSAEALQCSIHPANGTPTATLPGLAKVSQAVAQKSALASMNAHSVELVDSELEIEEGCLVYSFDIRISGKPVIEEILVDAGTGKILSRKHESLEQEEAEKAKDKATAK